MAQKKHTPRRKKFSFWGVAKAVAGFLWNAAVWIGKIVWRGAKLAWQFAAEQYRKGKIEKERKNAQAGSLGAEFSALKEVRAFEGSPGDFENWLYSSKSTVGIILGSRGSGKSALGMRLLENWVAKGARAFAMGFDAAAVPEWITCVEGIENAENGSVLLVDESGIEFSSRSSMSDANKLLSKLLLISRHKDISLIFIAQNSANLEINSIRQADYLLMKKPSLLQKDFERNKIRDMYADVDKDFRELSSEKGLVYVYSDRFRGFASNTLPSFWSERASKAYRASELAKKA